MEVSYKTYYISLEYTRESRRYYVDFKFFEHLFRFSFCRTKYGVDEMCRDQWNWASKNPYGYCGSPDNSN